jgi:RNA polymerase sigma-70 factor (ECF subfamily)
MKFTSSPNNSDVFYALRPRLFSIAYRMLGTRADAEDVLQDTWLRWHGADHAALNSAEAWLVTVVTRLAIDRLRAAKVERAAYVGWWLPEPLVDQDERKPEAAAELAGELSIALMWVLERLSAEERAAFLLRQVFDHDYDEIAALLGKSQAACRQMVHRASERVQQAQPRFEVSHTVHRQLLEHFMLAAQAGNRQALASLLASDAELVSDGGGKVPSFPKRIHGAERIARLYGHVPKKAQGQHLYRPVWINGEPGLLRYFAGQLESAQAFAVDAGRIAAIYVVRNPDKLTAISQVC